jgi:hypothetical protein
LRSNGRVRWRFFRARFFEVGMQRLSNPIDP